MSATRLPLSEAQAEMKARLAKARKSKLLPAKEMRKGIIRDLKAGLSVKRVAAKYGCSREAVRRMAEAIQ